MTVYELINKLVQLPNSFGHYQIKVHVGYSKQSIETLSIDQLQDQEPVILIELK